MLLPVLLVEDKDSLRAMLRHALEAQGHAVLEARDEPEALQQLRQTGPPSSSPISSSRRATALACCAPPRSSIPSCRSSS